MNWRAFLFIPALAIGVVIYMYQVGGNGGETGSEALDQSPLPIRSQTVSAAPLDIEISGFGRVDPIASWQAVSQVSGRVTELADNFAEGSVLGTAIQAVALDTRDYEIALAKAKANLATANADLEELNAEEINTASQIELETQVEAFLQSEFDRKERLVQRHRPKERGRPSRFMRIGCNRLQPFVRRKPIGDVTNLCVEFRMQRCKTVLANCGTGLGQMGQINQICLHQFRRWIVTRQGSPQRGFA